MLVKKHSIDIGGYKAFAPMEPRAVPRVYHCKNGDILVISNDENGYTFNTFGNDGLISSSTLDYSYGQLVFVSSLGNGFWLEFRDRILLHEEEYNLVYFSGDTFRHITAMPRESYIHDLNYHHIFEKEDGIYLNIIRHNRVHQFHIGEAITEVDYLEGGKWFLCGKYSISVSHEIAEIYDEYFEFCNYVEFDYEVANVAYSFSPNGDTFALAVSDMNYVESLIASYNIESKTINASIAKHTVSDIGISHGRVISSLYCPEPENELFGAGVHDKNMNAVYIHIRPKSSQMGICPPPFSNSEGIYQLPNHSTLVVENSKITILDHLIRPVQEISLCGLFCAGISGTKAAVLRLEDSSSDSAGMTVYGRAYIDLYEWDGANSDGKIIEMFNFSKKVPHGNL